MLTYFTNLESVGLYNIAIPTARLVLFFASAVTFILMPLISSLNAKKDYNVMNKLVNMSYKLALLFLLPIALVMIAYPELIIRILYSAEYTSAGTALALLAVSSIFTLLFSINSQILNGIGKAKLNAKTIMIGSIFNIALNLILIPLYGINGAAFSTMLGYILMANLGFYQINKHIKNIKINFFSSLKFLVPSSSFLISIYLLKQILKINIWLELSITITVALILYILSVFLTKILTINNIKEIIKLYKK
jgi:O-antigen/teichoic acid export membrane protein